MEEDGLVGTDEHGLWADSSMHDPKLVKSGQRTERSPCHAQRTIRVEWSFHPVRPQGLGWLDRNRNHPARPTAPGEVRIDAWRNPGMSGLPQGGVFAEEQVLVRLPLGFDLRFR